MWNTVLTGKSTYLRQIGLLAVMAMSGSFVPAEYASFRFVLMLLFFYLTLLCEFFHSYVYTECFILAYTTPSWRAFLMMMIWKRAWALLQTKWCLLLWFLVCNSILSRQSLLFIQCTTVGRHRNIAFPGFSGWGWTGNFTAGRRGDIACHCGAAYQTQGEPFIWEFCSTRRVLTPSAVLCILCNVTSSLYF
jgi:hypothetical protein